MPSSPVDFRILLSGIALGGTLAAPIYTYAQAPGRAAQSTPSLSATGLAVSPDTARYFSMLPFSARLDIDRDPSTGLRLKSARSDELRLSAAGQAGGASSHSLATVGRRWTSSEMSSAWGPASVGLAVLRGYEGLGIGQQGLAVTDSASLSLRGMYRLGESWGLAGQFAAGYSDGNVRWADGATYRLGVSRTDFVTLGLFKNETLLRGDRLSLSVGQPIRATGATGGERPFELYDFGTSTRADNMMFRPSARELITELNYFAPINRHSGLGLSLVNRSRLNQESAAPYERILSIRYATQF